MLFLGTVRRGGQTDRLGRQAFRCAFRGEGEGEREREIGPGLAWIKYLLVYTTVQYHGKTSKVPFFVAYYILPYLTLPYCNVPPSLPLSLILI